MSGLVKKLRWWLFWRRVKWIEWPTAKDGSTGALLITKSLTEEEKEAIRARFQERYGGHRNAHRAWQEDEA